MGIQEAQTWDTPVCLCAILEQFLLLLLQWVALVYLCADYCRGYLQSTEQNNSQQLKCVKKCSHMLVDLSSDVAAILNFIVSNSYYGMLRRQISMYLPLEHPTIAIWTMKFKMATISEMRSMYIVIIVTWVTMFDLIEICLSFTNPTRHFKNQIHFS